MECPLRPHPRPEHGSRRRRPTETPASGSLLCRLGPSPENLSDPLPAFPTSIVTACELQGIDWVRRGRSAWPSMMTGSRARGRWIRGRLWRGSDDQRPLDAHRRSGSSGPLRWRPGFVAPQVAASHSLRAPTFGGDAPRERLAAAEVQAEPRPRSRWSGSNDRDGYEPSGDSYCSRDSGSRGVEQPMRGCDRRYDAPDSVDACRAPPVEGGVSPAGPLGWAETRTFAIGRMSLSQREADDHSFPRGSRPGEAAPLKGFEPTHEVRVEVGVGLDGGCTMQPCPLDRGIEQ